MADSSLYVSLVAQVLADDPTLNALVDGQIVPGFRRSQADLYLTGTNQACIGIRNLNGNTQPLPGCYFHGGTIEDQLVEIHIINISNNDEGANAIAAQIKDLLKAGLYCTLNGVDYKATVLYLTFSPVDDNQAPANWVQIIGTCRLKYLDS
jgi:hypothetical protein